MRNTRRPALPLLAVASLLLVAACSERTGLGDDPAGSAATAARPSFAISDATNSGRAGFYFLSPILPTLPSYPGTFDPAVAATARVCTPVATCATPVATFTTGGGGLTVDLARQAYVATWAVPASLTLGTGNYRLEVLAAGTTLGFADLNVVAASSPSIPGYVNAVRGGTLTIRFRIETGMVGAVAVSPPSASVSPGGTQGYTATVTDLHGNPIASPTVAWQSSNTGVATVSPGSGPSTTATGVANGSANIVATSNGVSGQGTLTVSTQTAPTAVADAYQANAGSSITVPAGTGLLANDALGTPAATVASYGGGSLGGAVTDHGFGTTTTFGTGGSLTVNGDGSVQFTPPAGFTGDFIFQYRLTNAAGSSDATVTISVVRVPTAVNDTYTDPLSGSLNVAAPGVMANDDRGVPQGSVASFGGGDLGGTVTTNAAGATVSDGHGGTVQLKADGQLTHTPSGSFFGSITFSYRLTNTVGSSDATVTINVPQAPSAVADAYTATAAGTLTVPASGVLANDVLGTPAATITSFGGGSLGGSVTSNAVGATVNFGTGGSLTLNADGSLSFQRSSGFTGVFTFQYRLTNAFGTSDAAVTITVPRAPDAVNDANAPGSAPGSAFHTALNTTLAIPSGATPNLLANDDRGVPQGDVTSFGEIVVGALPAMGTVTTNAAGATVALPDGGSLTVNADGTGSFTPGTNFTGLVTFKYRLANTAGFDDATVTIAVGTRPAATNDGYGTILGNVDIDTDRSSEFTVLANDQGSVLSVTLVPGSAQHGTASVQPNGKFTFNPERGYEGPASFQYQIANGLGTSTGTVSLTVRGMVWFIDDDAAAGGDGTFLAKYNTLAAFQSANLLGGGANPDNNEAIFLFTGSYTGPVTLRPGQRFVGQGAVNTSLADVLGLTWPTDGPTQPSIGGTRPTITSGANDVNLASGNTVRGMNLGNATGIALSGSNFGTLTVAQLGISTTGQAIDLATGTIDGDFSQVTSAGGASNVVLASVGTNGTTDLGTASDALSGASGNALSISGAGGSFTYAGSITNTTALAVNIANKTGGSVTVSGSINPGAAARGILVTGNGTGTNTISFSGAAQKISVGSTTRGVELTNNAGATIEFTGGALTVSTDDGDAFRATGGGTVKVTGAGNTLASTGGIALNVQSTTIGAGGLNFQRIDANGGTNGILLNATGNTAGLTVAGNSAAGTGGTIQHTGTGISLTSTTAPSFSWMQLNDHTAWAVKGTDVAGFSMTRTVINGANGSDAGADNGSVHFTNLTGSASITNSSISGGLEDNLTVVQTSGTLDRLTLDAVTIGANNTTLGEDGVSIDATGGTAKVTIQNSTFTSARSRLVNAIVQGSASSDLVIQNTAFSNNHANQVSNAQAIVLAVGGSATMTYSVLNNTIRDSKGTALFAGKQFGSGAGNGTMSGTISGNQIGVNGIANSGSLIGSDIEVLVGATGSHTTLIRNNTLRQYNAQGILVTAGIGVTPVNEDAAFNVTIQGNTITQPGTTTPPSPSRNGIQLNSGVDPGDAYAVCLNIGDPSDATKKNTVTGSGADPAGLGNGSDIRLRQRQNTTVKLPGYTGAFNSVGDLTTYLTPRTNGAFTLLASAASTGFQNTTGGAACPLP